MVDLLDKSTLTNQVHSYKSVTFGRMPLEVLSAIYQSEAVQVEEPVLLIHVNKIYRHSMTERELSDFTREVYQINRWHTAGTTPNTRRREEVDRPGRWEFTGQDAEGEIRQKYLLKSVDAYFGRGTRNPIVYVNC